MVMYSKKCRELAGCWGEASKTLDRLWVPWRNSMWLLHQFGEFEVTLC